MWLTFAVLALLADGPAQQSAPPPAAGVVRITSVTRSGTSLTWEIGRDRLLALPPWNPVQTTLPLSLVEAVNIAEKWATQQNPGVKRWVTVNAALSPLTYRPAGINAPTTLASWYYNVQLAPGNGSFQAFFPGQPGEAGRLNVVVLLDGSIVEPRTEPVPAVSVASPLLEGTTDVYVVRPGTGVVAPRATNRPLPRYTAAAMEQRIQGDVVLQCVVDTDGRCQDIKVIRSLDALYGLDREAVRAVQDYRFTPGTLNGKPVKVSITIELSFNLK